MDEKAIQMSHDNEWMASKIVQYRQELEKLKKEANDLEEENVKLMNYLCDCNSQDLIYLKFVLLSL